MREIIKNLILQFFIYPKLRRNIKSIRPDEDGLAYLLDLLQEDEKRLYVNDRTCFDRQYNIEIQEQLKKQIKKYGYSY
jgi:hypothetical protein